jgi:hypothetical protein
LKNTLSKNDKNGNQKPLGSHKIALKLIFDFRLPRMQARAQGNNNLEEITN